MPGPELKEQKREQLPAVVLFPRTVTLDEIAEIGQRKISGAEAFRREEDAGNFAREFLLEPDVYRC